MRKRALSYPDANLSRMWRYTLKDLHPGDDPETWARDLAEQGWRLWKAGNGAKTTVNGRTFRRYSLRRWEGEGEPPGNTRGSYGKE